MGSFLSPSRPHSCPHGVPFDLKASGWLSIEFVAASRHSIGLCHPPFLPHYSVRLWRLVAPIFCNVPNSAALNLKAYEIESA